MDATTSTNAKTGTLTLGDKNYPFPLLDGTIGPDVLDISNGFNLTTAVVSPVGSQPALVISGTTGGGFFESHAVWNASALTIDTVTGGTDGNDAITIGNGNSLVDAGADNDTVVIGNGNTAVFLGIGNFSNAERGTPDSV